MSEAGKKCLFVTYGGGHVALVCPLAQAMMSKGYTVKILALTTAQAYLKQRGVPFVGYSDMPESKAQDVQEYGRALAGEMGQAQKIDLAEAVAYLGLNYKDLVLGNGREKAEILYRQKGRQAFCPVRVMKTFLEREMPDIVIATTSPRSEKAAILAAGQLGVRCVCLVDLFAKQEVQWVGQPGYANKVCVLNENVRDFLLKVGRAT